MLFQRAASMSTSPLLWTGPEDRRVRLRVLPWEDAEGQARSDSLAVFLGGAPSMAQQAGWGEVRVWNLAEQEAGHGSGCGCCQVGGRLGRFLISLTQERARGACIFFHNLSLVCPAREVTALVQLLHIDPLVFSLYGLEAVPARFSCYY